MRYITPSTSIFAIVTLICVGSINAQVVIFEATPSNTTMVNNGRENHGKLTLTGATPDLILNNDNGAFNMGGAD